MAVSDSRGPAPQVVPQQKFGYDFGNRKATVEFYSGADEVTVRIAFDAEAESAIEMQKQGWLANLNHFAKLMESKGWDAPWIESARLASGVNIYGKIGLE